MRHIIKRSHFFGDDTSDNPLQQRRQRVPPHHEEKRKFSPFCIFNSVLTKRIVSSHDNSPRKTTTK